MSDIQSTAPAAETVSESPSTDLADTSTPSFEAEVTESTSVESTETAPAAAEVAPGIFEIDGVQVSLEDARTGFMQRADYTRKTQELAEQRTRLNQAEAISAALEADPVNTLNALAEAFGVQVQAAPSDPFEGLDPEQTRLAQLEARFTKQDEAARQTAIDTELSDLTSKYGEIDQSALFAHAIKGNFPSLKAAYAEMSYDSLLATTQAAEQRASEELGRVEAKRAAQVLEQGAATAANSTAPAAVAHTSFRDAFLAAKTQLGL